jgi:membrane fusion protein (multidrug efflux system)
VEVAVAWADTVIDAITATGQIEAIQSIELRPEVDGRLVEILVREGSEVARAEADRDLARQGLDRTRQLLAEKAAAPADVERAEATMRSTQAALDLLQLRLDRTVVRAPFTGVAGQRLASLGDYVGTGTRLITLQTVHPQRASFQVPERYADRLRIGQRVQFQVAALPGRDFAGTVDFVDPQVQLPGRTITVKAAVPNPSRVLQAGMFIEARLATEVRAGAVVVPEDAVTQIQGGAFVWLAVDNKATRRRVELGVRTPGYVEIRDGITSGDLVVVGGLDRLTEGIAVQATVVDRRQERPDSVERTETPEHP